MLPPLLAECRNQAVQGVALPMALRIAQQQEPQVQLCPASRGFMYRMSGLCSSGGVQAPLSEHNSCTGSHRLAKQSP